MSAAEISGYVQIVIGLIGIALTITNIRKLVPDINLFAGKNGAPPGLDNASGFLRILLLFCLLNFTAFLICMGFSITLSSVYKSLSANSPLLSSSMTIAAIVSMSVTSAMGLYRIRFWVPGFVGSTGLAACAIVSAVTPSMDVFWTAAGISLALVAVTGLGVFISFLE